MHVTGIPLAALCQLPLNADLCWGRKQSGTRPWAGGAGRIKKDGRLLRAFGTPKRGKPISAQELAYNGAGISSEGGRERPNGVQGHLLITGWALVCHLGLNVQRKMSPLTLGTTASLRC